MITSINQVNADKYRVLFSDAAKALKDAGKLEAETKYVPVDLTEDSFMAGFHYKSETGADGSWVLSSMTDEFESNMHYAVAVEPSISSLEEYFSFIEELLEISKRYTILPLDEDFFEIDANARTITVPAEFRTNGISVQGDEIAEILYFKINRYFDMDDLSTKDILIEWRAPANEQGERIEGVSRPWVVDIESIPGYILFGWALSSEVTKTPGTIDFSVRFYKNDIENNRISYSFSTLTQSAIIKQGLNYDIKTILLEEDLNVDDPDELIRDRLENTIVNDASIPDPVKPVIVDNLIKNVKAYDKQEPTEDEKTDIVKYIVYLTDTETGEEAPGQYIIQATVSDAGIISYTWIRKDEDGDYHQNLIKDGTAHWETDDEVQDKNKVYYEYNELTDALTPFEFTPECPDIFAYPALHDGKKLHEKGTYVTIDCDGENVIGQYQCRVVNRVGRKTTRKMSDIIIVPRPAEVNLTTDLEERNTLTTVGNESKLRLSVDIDNEHNIHSHDYITYEWFKRTWEGESGTNGKWGDWESIYTGKTMKNNSYTIEGKPYELAESFADNGDGYYKVVVTAKLNSKIATVESSEIRVTHKASPVLIDRTEPTLAGTDNYDINSPFGVIATPIKEELWDADRGDVLTYQWYRYVNNETTPDKSLAVDLVAAQNGEYKVKGDAKVLEASATTPTLIIPNTHANEGGYYFCEVTNTYNGTSVSKCSPFFNVIDTDVRS